MMSYSIFKTLSGWMGVVETEKGVKKIILPQAKLSDVEKIIFEEFPGVEENRSRVRHIADSLARYYEGENITFPLSFDPSGHTEFSVAVWKATRTIPWGEVRTYQWIGAQIKKPRSFRAVGSALGKNPFPIVVPCHRVIRSDGMLGGFSAPGGIFLKQRLLELEGVLFDSKGRVAGFKKK